MAEQSDFKYLAIRNWGKYQTMTDKNGKTLDGRPRPYIRDYCDKETDSQYAALSVIARYLYDGCRRLRGKHGRNLLNDHMWILRQLDVDGTERGRCTHALQSLITRGLLIPTNQQFDVPQAAATSLEVDVNIDVKSISTPVSPSAMSKQDRSKSKQAKTPDSAGISDRGDSAALEPGVYQIEEDDVEVPRSTAFEIED